MSATGNVKATAVVQNVKIPNTEFVQNVKIQNIEFVVKIQKFVKNVEKGKTDFFDTKKGEWHNVS